jgi:hypothetical protein
MLLARGFVLRAALREPISVNAWSGKGDRMAKLVK